MPKFFVEALGKTLSRGTLTGESLPPNILHHLAVLRVRRGEEIILCSDCTDYRYIIEETHPLRLALLRAEPCETELPSKVVLFQGLPKGSKMDEIVQKCVELGAAEIVPVVMERSVRTACKRERWQKIARSAAEQSMRGVIPKVREVFDFSGAVEYARAIQESGCVFVGHVGRKSSADSYGRAVSVALGNFVDCARTWHAMSLQKPIGIWVGPEGGFSEKELTALAQFTFVTLGKRTLRTETAGMVALAQISMLLEAL